MTFIFLFYFLFVESHKILNQTLLDIKLYKCLLYNIYRFEIEMGETMLAWATKYFFRVMHIGPMMFLGYKIILDYMNDTLSTQHAGFFGVMGVLTALAGLINTFLLKPKTMGQNKKLWMRWHHIKFIITICLFSPVYKYLITDNDLIKIRFYFMLTCLLVSPFMRFYRQYHVAKNKENQIKKI